MQLENDLFTLFEKKITPMYRWGTPQNFFLAFMDELEKQIVIKKLLNWASKKQNNFNIYNVAIFLKKRQREIPVDIIIKILII